MLCSKFATCFNDGHFSIESLENRKCWNSEFLKVATELMTINQNIHRHCGQSGQDIEYNLNVSSLNENIHFLPQYQWKSFKTTIYNLGFILDFVKNGGAGGYLN